MESGTMPEREMRSTENLSLVIVLNPPISNNNILNFYAAFPCPPTWAKKICSHTGDFKV